MIYINFSNNTHIKMLQLFCKLQTNIYFCITQKLQKVKRSMDNLRFEVVKEAFRKNLFFVMN